MRDYNRVEVMGRLGGEPELRFSATSKPVVSFTVASNHQYIINGEVTDEVDWFNVVAWNKLAENCNQYLVKGQLVFVAGRVSLNQWKSQDGQERSRLQINANTVIFLSKPRDAKTPIGAEELEPEGTPF